MAETCNVEGCDNGGRITRGWCNMHYLRWRNHGDPHVRLKQGRKRQDPVARFWSKVDVGHPLGCWEWTSAFHRGGYGLFAEDGSRPASTLAHRHAYVLLVGPIPSGMQLDHLCRNRACVNPDHLEPVTQRENKLRGESVPARKARQTECQHGHPFTKENTYVDKRGHRHCRACRRVAHLRRVG